MDDCRLIENLIYRYAERIDAGDLEGVAQLFRNAVIVAPQHGGRTSGYDEVLSLYRKSCRIYASSGTPLTRHLTTNVIIEIDASGSNANSRSCYTVIQSTATLPLQPIISGRYHDTFRKAEDGWEFAHREMWVDLLGDLSQHLLYALD